MFHKIIEKYLLKLNCVSKKICCLFSVDWLFEGYFTELHSMINNMYEFVNKIYDNISYVNLHKNEKEKINKTLKEFNKAVIREIEKFRVKLEKIRKTKITFNNAAMEWIDKNYKAFKEKWFKSNCDCKHFFNNNKKLKD